MLRRILNRLGLLSSKPDLNAVRAQVFTEIDPFVALTPPYFRNNYVVELTKTEARIRNRSNGMIMASTPFSSGTPSEVAWSTRLMIERFL